MKLSFLSRKLLNLLNFPLNFSFLQGPDLPIHFGPIEDRPERPDQGNVNMIKQVFRIWSDSTRLPLEKLDLSGATVRFSKCKITKDDFIPD